MYPTTETEPLALPRPRLNQGRSVREVIDLLVLIGAIYALVNLTTVRFIVQGISMEPTFQDAQFLIVSRVNYLFGDPERGDIVVFHYPGDPTEDYIKRLIGLPGDTIEFRDTQLYVNGELWEEPYINEPCSPRNCRNQTWTLGEDEFFMMGDNRNRSSDSREFDTPVRREHIVGEVVLRYWPVPDWAFTHQIGFPSDR